MYDEPKHQDSSSCWAHGPLDVVLRPCSPQKLKNDKKQIKAFVYMMAFDRFLALIKFSCPLYDLSTRYVGHSALLKTNFY